MQYNYYIRCWKDDENISRTGKGQGIHYQHFWEASLWEQYILFWNIYVFDGTFTIKSGTYDPDSVACRWDDYVDSFMEWVAAEKPRVGTKYQLSKDSGLYSFMGLDYIIPYLKEFGLIKIWRQPIGKLWDEEYWWGIEVLPLLTMISALYEDPDIDDEIDRRVEEEEAFELDDRIRFAYEAYISRMMQEQKSEGPFWLFANKDEDHSRQTIDLEVSFRDIDCKRVIRMNLTDTLYDLHWMIQKAVKFDNDHLFEFTIGRGMMKKRYTLPEAINSDQELSVDETRLKNLELRKGQKFTYLFDFGDMWWFDIKVLAIQEGSVEKPMLIKAVNDAPEQYPMYEEEVENCKAEISSHGSFRSRWSG